LFCAKIAKLSQNNVAPYVVKKLPVGIKGSKLAKTNKIPENL
tara:strand:+ start:432 stop:557 length:126 start_codon:yes stop_codon:yes gene_type:complete